MDGWLVVDAKPLKYAISLRHKCCPSKTNSPTFQRRRQTSAMFHVSTYLFNLFGLLHFTFLGVKGMRMDLSRDHCV